MSIHSIIACRWIWKSLIWVRFYRSIKTVGCRTFWKSKPPLCQLTRIEVGTVLGETVRMVEVFWGGAGDRRGEERSIRRSTSASPRRARSAKSSLRFQLRTFAPNSPNRSLLLFLGSHHFNHLDFIQQTPSWPSLTSLWSQESLLR